MMTPWKWKLGKKLTLSFLITGIVPLAIFGTIAVRTAEDAMARQAFNQLESLREVKRAAVERYFDHVTKLMSTFAENRMTVMATQQLKEAFPRFRAENNVEGEKVEEFRKALRTYYAGEFTEEYRRRNEGAAPDVEGYFGQLDDDSVALQYHYIRANTHPLGSKHLLDRPEDASAYSNLHEQYHPVFRSYLEKFGLYDIFLVHPETGDIVYTVFKELDFTTSLIDGPNAKSNIGEVFRKANAAGNRDAVLVVDYARYLPSYEAPAAFIASPVFDGDRKIGIAIFQFPIDRLNEIMSERSGLGITGETYLVGADGLMRSDSFRDRAGRSVEASFRHPERARIDTAAVREALAGKTGTGIFPGYHGSTVLSAYMPVKAGPLTWALVAEIDRAEAFSAIRSLQWLTGIVAAVALLAIVAFALPMTRSIVGPVERTVRMIRELEGGRLGMRLHLKRKDEIGEMAAAMDAFADSLEHEVVAALQGMAQGDLTFAVQPRGGEDRVRGALQQVGADLNRLLAEVRLGGERIASGSAQVADSSQALSQGATEQASSQEEISASLHQLGSRTRLNADHAAQASALALQARGAAGKGNLQMDQMIDAMGEISAAGENISRIIKVIDEIAFQTNLLALNAAVEAARAGQHGRGFAVVAEEVRNLAARSAAAARETADIIEGTVIKTKTGTLMADRTGEALGEIVAAISKASDLVAEIAAASREQAEGIGQISLGLEQIGQVTQHNTANAEETAAAAQELSGESARLRELLSRFRLQEKNRFPPDGETS